MTPSFKRKTMDAIVSNTYRNIITNALANLIILISTADLAIASKETALIIKVG